MGTVMENLGQRKAELTNMVELAGYLRMEFVIPARGLIGFRAQFLTATKGNGIMNHVFHGYAPYKGEIPSRTRGALVAFENGETTPYGLNSVQDRVVHCSLVLTKTCTQAKLSVKILVNLIWMLTHVRKTRYQHAFQLPLTKQYA